MPLARTVADLLGKLESSRSLLILDTHGHQDHRAGDPQFASLPNVELVGSDLPGITKHFGWSRWPAETAQIDLGDRIVDVLPAPGHHEAHLTFYDRQTQLLFSGDMLLSGRLLIADTKADMASAERLAGFARSHLIRYVLGGHIELDRAGNLFLGESYHRDERPLQLTAKDVVELPKVLSYFNGLYSRHGDVVMMNQNRVLAVYAAGALFGVVAIWLGLRTLWKRRKRRKPAGA
jgi:glyoxylase-like metal-dependent hydrolase (beta-lactamase superfamily II)